MSRDLIRPIMISAFRIRTIRIGKRSITNRLCTRKIRLRSGGIDVLIRHEASDESVCFSMLYVAKTWQEYAAAATKIVNRHFLRLLTVISEAAFRGNKTAIVLSTVYEITIHALVIENVHAIYIVIKQKDLCMVSIRIG